MTPDIVERLNGRQILIVEDQYLIAEELRLNVAALGGDPLPPCNDLACARKCLLSKTVDLALLDINLNGEMVFDFIDELIERGTPFVFVTGYDDWMIPPYLRDAPRVEKPMTADKLREALNGLPL